MTSSSWLPAVLALIATLAGVAVNYVLTTRRSRGQIRTSEAEVLWQASESIRHDLTEYVKALTAKLAAMEVEMNALRLENAKLQRRLDRLERSDA